MILRLESRTYHSCPTLNDSSIFPGTLIPYKGRSYSWLPFNTNGTIILTSDLMNELDLCIGTELLSIRSSDIAFTMGAKGPLLEKAHNYTGKIQRY